MWGSSKRQILYLFKKCPIINYFWACLVWLFYTLPTLIYRHSFDEGDISTTKPSMGAKSHKVQTSLRKREKFARSHNAPPIIVDNVDEAKSQ